MVDGARTWGKEVLNDEMGFLVSWEVEVPLSVTDH